MLVVATWVYLAIFVYMAMHTHRIFAKCQTFCYDTNDVISVRPKQWCLSSVGYCMVLRSFNGRMPSFYIFHPLKLRPWFQPILYLLWSVTTSNYPKKIQIRGGNWPSNSNLQVLIKWLVCIKQYLNPFLDC